jgi:hypothetical protein
MTPGATARRPPPVPFLTHSGTRFSQNDKRMEVRRRPRQGSLLSARTENELHYADRMCMLYDAAKEVLGELVNQLAGHADV